MTDSTAEPIKIDLMEAEYPGPNDGHTWRIIVASRSSSKVVGDEDYHDAGSFIALPDFVEVRAWSLKEALLKAADLPLHTWFPNEEVVE